MLRIICNQLLANSPVIMLIPNIKKEEAPVVIIRCAHCNMDAPVFSGNYCSIMCMREVLFGSPWWQD